MAAAEPSAAARAAKTANDRKSALRRQAEEKVKEADALVGCRAAPLRYNSCRPSSPCMKHSVAQLEQAMALDPTVAVALLRARFTKGAALVSVSPPVSDGSGIMYPAQLLGASSPSFYPAWVGPGGWAVKVQLRDNSTPPSPPRILATPFSQDVFTAATRLEQQIRGAG